MRNFSTSELVAVYDMMDYKLFTGVYNLNIYGVRNKEQTANSFDDVVGVLYQDASGKWINKQWKATTDPGLYWLNNPMRKEGTAIMIPDQYLGAYKLGLHKGYRALEQKKPMRYVRDNNKDNYLDFTLMENPKNIITDNIKSNIHRTNDKGVESTRVDKWSAACQVLADSDDFEQLLELCEIAEKRYGNSFTYTLFTLAQIDGWS